MLMLILASGLSNIRCACISIHLMLMLIKAVKAEVIAETNISIHLMLMLILYKCHCFYFHLLYFNTSHVNVNPVRNYLTEVAQRFQYISC